MYAVWKTLFGCAFLCYVCRELLNFCPIIDKLWQRIKGMFGIFKRVNAIFQNHPGETRLAKIFLRMPSFQQPAPGRWLVNWGLLELWLSASLRTLPGWCVHRLHDRWHRTALSVIGISHLAEQQGTPKCQMRRTVWVTTIFINMFKIPRTPYRNHPDCTIGATRGSFHNHT